MKLYQENHNFMTNWLRKFKLSNALHAADHCESDPRVARNPELEHFRDDLQRLDRELAQGLPTVNAPAFLHSRIMNALTKEQGRARSSSPFTFSRSAAWQCGLAVVVAALFALLIGRQPASHKDSNSQAIATLTSSLPDSDSVFDSVPAALSTPLSRELSGLDRDVANTSQYLLANLP